MSFFADLFSRKSLHSLALLEIGPDSIAGGLLHTSEGQPSLMVYTKRMQIEPQSGEEPLVAVTRTLNALGENLLTEGAPLLARAAGSGHVHSVLVSVKAPWQETSIRSEKIERTESFVFTRSMINVALKKASEAPSGRLLADEIVVGTILDGYETKVPVGKRASRVSIIVLSSFIDQEFSHLIAQSLRKTFHTSAIRLVAAAALRNEALRALFPLEQDYLLIDVAGDAIVTSLVRRGLLSAVEHATYGGNPGDQDAWLAALKTTLESITKRYPLPRKVFLIAAEKDRLAYKEKLETASLATLRLSEESPMVLVVAPTQFTDEVKLGDKVEPDLGLGLMAIFHRGVEL